VPKKITYRTTHDSITISVDKELTLSWTRRGSALKYLPSTQLGSPKNFAFRQIIGAALACCGATPGVSMGTDTEALRDALKASDGDLFSADFKAACTNIIQRTTAYAKRIDVSKMSVSEMEVVVTDWSLHDLSLVRQVVKRLDAELPADAAFRPKLDLVMRSLATIQS
jgi:hypothetical protein